MPSVTQEAKDIRKKRIFALCCVLVVLVVFCLLTYFVGKPILAVLRENPDQLRAHMDSYGVGGYFVMIGIVIMQVVIAFIPGEPVEVAAGVVFGAWWGAALCLIGSALAAALVFTLVKKYGMKLVYLFFSREKVEEVAFLNDSGKLNLLLFVLFLIPGTPKDVLTYFAGVTSIKLPAFLLITTVARIPSVLSSTLFGSKLMEERYLAAAIIYGVTIVLSVMGVLWYKKMRKRRKESGDPAQKPEP